MRVIAWVAALWICLEDASPLLKLKGMAVVTTTILIRAPIERVFDLSRSVDLHTRSAGPTRETAVSGVTSGLIGPGQTVTWEGTHFGIRQKLTSKMTLFSRPDHFRDSMISGAFRRFDHDHFFTRSGDATIVKDVFDFQSPCGMVGQAIDLLVLKFHMRNFLSQRNEMIKEVAEGTDWERYLPPLP